MYIEWKYLATQSESSSMLDKIFWKVSSAVSVITVFSLLAFFCVKNCQNIILFLKKVATVATLGPAFTQYWVVLSRLKSQGKQCYHFTECLHLGTLQFWSFDWEILLTNQNCRLLGCKHSKSLILLAFSANFHWHFYWWLCARVIWLSVLKVELPSHQLTNCFDLASLQFCM